jgi:predicted molibdopterin-dependent oxidoreductase YjgC
MRAQSVWQASSWLEQLLTHDWLAVALLVVVAAPVGAVPGTTQAVWQLAACELQLIMQLVVVEVCASRIDLLLPAAGALAAHATTTNADRRMVTLRTFASSVRKSKNAG